MLVLRADSTDLKTATRLEPTRYDLFDFAELDFRCSDVPMGERMDFHQSGAISGLLGIRCLVVVERSQRLQGGS